MQHGQAPPEPTVTATDKIRLAIGTKRPKARDTRNLSARSRYRRRRWAPTPDEAVRYTTGGCWPLALALHRMTGLGFVAIMESTYSHKWGTPESVVQHVMLRVGRNRYLDVNGVSTWRRYVRTLAREGIDASEWWIEDVDEGFLRSTARERDEDGDTRLSPLRNHPEAKAVARRIVAALGLARPVAPETKPQRRTKQ